MGLHFPLCNTGRIIRIAWGAGRTLDFNTAQCKRTHVGTKVIGHADRLGGSLLGIRDSGKDLGGKPAERELPARRWGQKGSCDPGTRPRGIPQWEQRGDFPRVWPRYDRSRDPVSDSGAHNSRKTLISWRVSEKSCENEQRTGNPSKEQESPVHRYQHGAQIFNNERAEEGLTQPASGRSVFSRPGGLTSSLAAVVKDLPWEFCGGSSLPCAIGGRTRRGPLESTTPSSGCELPAAGPASPWGWSPGTARGKVNLQPLPGPSSPLCVRTSREPVPGPCRLLEGFAPSRAAFATLAHSAPSFPDGNASAPFLREPGGENWTGRTESCQILARIVTTIGCITVTWR